jgi:N-acetylmuramoyl-L-alanine amidase
MMTLMQDTYLDQSLTVASLVQDQFRQRAMRYDRGVKQAGFLVLWKTSMPSILIETGFVSNKSEEKFLSSKQGQDYLASAIFRAFRDYKALMEGNASELAHKEEAKVEATTKVEDKEMATNTAEKPVETPQQEAQEQKPKPQTTELDAEPLSGHTPKREISYKVQILYSENKVDLNSDLFKDFNDVEEIPYNGKYKYVVGSKPTYAEAIEYSKWVKNRHPDAFIVAVSNGKIIPLSEAILPKKTN